MKTRALPPVCTEHPCCRAIRTGDRLLQIDGVDITLLTEDDVRSLIIGPPGSSVELRMAQSNTGSFLGKCVPHHMRIHVTSSLKLEVTLLSCEGGLSEHQRKVVLIRQCIDAV
jgi:hypothetical protein